MSKNAKSKKNTDVSANYDEVYAPKMRFPLYIYPETMKTVESIYKSDNCSTKTEFMEKAIRFYCAHLMQNKPELIEYLAPQIAHIVEGYIMGLSSDCHVRYSSSLLKSVRSRICLRR